jgi:hypothetical protein
MTVRNVCLLLIDSFVACLICTETKGFWVTGGKTWDCIKWNYGNVFISVRAISEWFGRPEISSYRYPAEKLGGRRGSRAFVAEHIYPTRSLQALVLADYARSNPSEHEVATLLERFNKICYIWHEENDLLDRSGLRTSMPTTANQGDAYARYCEVGIEPIQTSFSNGPPLLRQLYAWRNEGMPSDVAIYKLAAPGH